MNDKFWYNDISVLFNRHNLLEIVPLKKYNLNRKLNATLRLAIYYSIIMYLINKNSSYFCIPFIVIIITVYIYKSHNKNENFDKEINISKNKDVNSVIDKLNDDNYRNPTIDNPMMNYLPNTMNEEDKYKEAIPTYNNIVASKLVDTNYNKKTFEDTDDIFNRNNGMRQFYTVPNTEVINRQGDFATWCYGSIGRQKLSI
jgi:hypothetical protein